MTRTAAALAAVLSNIERDAELLRQKLLDASPGDGVQAALESADGVLDSITVRIGQARELLEKSGGDVGGAGM